jgi:RNA polymerase sigma factor (sigma-70 family)
MRDSEVVASIVAGDPDGLAEAYDRYAAPLYSYCRTLLREPADAADAVQDTFLIASTQLANLRNPERLRAWLYAVARNECLRMLKSRQAVSAFDEASDITDETSDVSGDAERAELRALLRAAIRGLNSGEREIIELQAWQGLAAGDAAAALGITRGHAHTLLSRARDQLAASVGVLLVGRTGRRDCPALDTMLTGWDGQLTVLLRKRVSRHIDRCEVCSDRQRRELRPAMLLSLFPGMAAAEAAAEAIRHAGPVPAGLRDQLLAKASGSDPSAVAHRVAVGQRAGSFGKNGFPKATAAGKPVLRASRGRVITTAAGAAAVAAAVTAIVIATSGSPGQMRLAGGPSGGRPSVGAPQPSGGGTGPSGRPTATPSAGASAAPPSGTQPGAQPGGGGLGSPVSTVTSHSPTSGPGSGSSPSPGSSSPATQTSGPSAPPTSSSPSSAPPSSAPPSSPPPSSPPPSSPPPHRTPPPVTQGTLNVSPTTILLAPLLGGTVTLTANGGPVNWSISEPGSLIGQLTVYPSSGTIAADGSAQVTITTSLISLDSQLTVEPGGQQIAVLVGVGLLGRTGPG